MPLTEKDVILFATMRQRLDHEYEMAIAALDRFQNSFRKSDQSAASTTTSDSLIRALSETLSAREAVLLSIVDKWMNVQEIVASTGLTEKQVRGVLYAKPLINVIKRDRVSGSGAIRFQVSADDFSRNFRAEH